MGQDPFTPRPIERHLIVASVPTPNGRLHLGHIAGPFLRADILARHLRRRGNKVVLAAGVDVYESYMLLRARQDSTTPSPASVADRYCPLIRRDLEALNIEPDVWIDPLSPRWHDIYQRRHREVMNQLISRGRVDVETRSLMFSPKDNRFLTGCWLLGKCPTCGAATAGSSCEACGAHFPPYRMKEPRGRFGESDLQEREVDHFLLKIDYDALESYIGSVQIADEFRVLVQRALASRDFHASLVVPGSWGVAWPRMGGSITSVLFSYSFNLAFALVFGDAYQALTGESTNPFVQGSTVRLTATIGVDVLMPRAIILPAMAVPLGTRSFERLTINRFYNLGGAKFSTSRNHAIWAEDIITGTGLASDEVRFYLARTSPGVRETNFDPAEFCSVVNDVFAGRLAGLLSHVSLPLAMPPADSGPSEKLQAQLGIRLSNQDRVAETEPFDLPHYAHQLESWLDDELIQQVHANGELYWWLKGLALLSGPIIPRLAGALWKGFGHDGLPKLDAFQDRRAGKSLLPIARHLRLDALDPCLPTTMQRSTTKSSMPKPEEPSMPSPAQA